MMGRIFNCHNVFINIEKVREFYNYFHDISRLAVPDFFSFFFKSDKMLLDLETPNSESVLMPVFAKQVCTVGEVASHTQIFSSSNI